MLFKKPELFRGTPSTWAVPLHAGRVTHCVRVRHFTPLEARLAVTSELRAKGVLGQFRQIGHPVQTTKKPLA